MLTGKTRSDDGSSKKIFTRGAGLVSESYGNNQMPDERKLFILKAIVDDYIKSKEPVGSRTIAKKHDMGLSSATIRNEMADLEEMGYLSQPHTSAGRIPSDKAYRLYVDKMLSDGTPHTEDASDFVKYLENRIVEFNDVIKVASQMIADITNYTSIATTSQTSAFKIKAVQMVPIETGRALTVVVGENNVTKTRFVNIDSSIQTADLINLSSILNESFSGRPAEHITLEMINVIVARTGINREKILPIVDSIFECIKECAASEVFRAGDSNLLTHPEFTDINKARDVLDVINSDEIVESLLEKLPEDGNITVKIGSENELEPISDCSVVTASYKINDATVGTISVIGPVRMDYEKVIGALESVRTAMNNKIKEKGKTDQKDLKG